MPVILIKYYMESIPTNNKYEPYEADSGPEDSLIDNTPRIAVSEIIESLSESDRELVVENKALFRELDEASDGDARRRLIYDSDLEYQTGENKGGRLISIVENLQGRYRRNRN